MIFEATDDQIALLNDTDLRTLVGYLCEEEVRKQGHSPAAVTRGGNQTAKDGGIDVRVALVPGSQIVGYVPAAATGFQVKAQDMPRQEVLNEMAPKGILRESIEELAKQQGAYIIVSSRGSLADSALKERKTAMLAAISGKLSANSLGVDFYDRHRLATWVNQHPGLVPWVRAKVASPLLGWRPFGDWSSTPTTLDKPYLLDGAVRLVSPSLKNVAGLNATDGVNAIRRLLESPRCAVRLVGLSGVGKTRLVQALFDERIGTNALPPFEAVYTDVSDSPDPVPLELTSQLISHRRRAILIVDNCGMELHRKLAAKIAPDTGCLLSLITIEHDIADDEPENTDVFRLEAASSDLIEKILESRYPALAAPTRSVIAQFSDGNARIAFALAQTAKSGESLANLHDTDLFKRLFEQSKGPSEELLNGAKVCALLYSFDGETLDGADSELARLAGLAGLTVDQLHKHVAELARRQLVQKRSKWRAILPHALAHRLAKLALEDIPPPRIQEAIVNSGSARMLRSFSKRIGYLDGNAYATALVDKWFGKDGLLEPIGNLNELGETVLANVAPVDPALTLAFIERAAAQFPWFFDTENANRAQIVRILRSIAYDAALFDRAVALLKSFATHDNEDKHDSATDVLNSLFYLLLSGTHASPAQRAGFIKGLLEGESEAETRLGLKLLDTMLECWHFSSHYPFEFGARSRDFGSYPHTRAAFAEWFGQAIRVAESIGLSARPIAPQVRKILASNFSGLCTRGGMIDELAGVAEKFAERFGWPEGWIGVRSAIRKGKGLVEQSKLAKLEAVSDKLRPNNLADMIRTYAFSREWSTLDVADSEEDEELTPDKARTRIFELCVDLGRQLARDGELLEAMLPEILSAESQRTYAVGRGIAAGCASLTHCWRVLVERFLALSEPPRRQTLLGGFLDGAKTRDLASCEVILDGVLADPRMHPYLLYCQVNVGANDRAYARAMSALDLDTVPLHSYSAFAYGCAHEGLNDEQVRNLLGKLLKREGGASAATEIVGMRIFGAHSEKRPIGETLRAAGRDLLKRLPFDRQSAHADHLLGGIVKASLDKPEHEDLARLVAGRILDAIKSYRVNPWDVNEVIEGVLTAFPNVALDIFVGRDEEDEALGSRSIFRDVREGRACPLHSVPEHIWLKWAEAKPESRYVRLAEVVRYSDADDDDKARSWSPAAEKIIDAALEPARVLDVFLDRFSPMSWSGSRAEIMATRLPLIKALMHHARPEVVEWAKTHTETFAANVERERVSEARSDRIRDEAFE